MAKKQIEAPNKLNVIWEPLPGSQNLFITCPFFECLYEGTRGPGKSDALLMSYAQHVGQGYGLAWRGIIFREEYKQLDDLVVKSKKWFKQIFSKARFLESKADYKWVFPDEEELLFRVGTKADDYWNYHGHEYPFIGFDELPNWPSPDFYLAMMSCCRSSHPGIPKMYRATANPYGRGHNWVKARFIDPAPELTIIKDEKSGLERVRITGYYWENFHLLKNDPEYVERLKAQRDVNRRKAWLKACWDITAGGMLDDLFDREIHVIKPFKIPAKWYVLRSFDWGSSAPFSVGWWAEASDPFDVILQNGQQRTVPKGTLFRIGEWYGWNGNPNEGSRITATQIGKGIKEREDLLRAKYGVRQINHGPADTAIFDEQKSDEGKVDSIARKINKGFGNKESDHLFIPAHKGPGSRVNGWQLLRDRLEACLAFPIEKPGLFVTTDCVHWIRTVPVLPRDSKNMDDVDTTSEDHVGDETRYVLQTAKPPKARKIKVAVG